MIEELKQAYETYIKDLNNWLVSNGLTTLQNFEHYKNANTWGQSFLKDQQYFEKISQSKDTVFGVISKVEQLKQDGDRAVRTKADTFLNQLATEQRRLDNLLFTARERLKFYENIMRVIGNVTWGSY